ncbi:MAG TPA: sigma factor [Ktedonosporobacter sp.]|nr:sigma factor [Ktedonosporobacter sp.]
MLQLETPLPVKQERDEETLKRFDTYIVSQVHHISRTYRVTIHPEVLDLELDDLIQRIRIHFWQALEKRHIDYPYAYLQRMIRNELISMGRRQKQFVPLPTDEEWSEQESRETSGPRMPDPAEEVEQRMEALACLNEVIQAILKLPARQRLAMICSLQERVDDRAQLVRAFKAHRVDIEAMRWPGEKQAKHVVQASLAPARRALVKNLKKQTDHHFW